MAAELAFEVLRFSAAPASPDVAVVELEGRFRAPARRRLSRLRLVAEDDVGRVEVPPMDPPPAVADPDGAPWRASFALPLRLVDGATYALAVERLLVDLPAPDAGQEADGRPDLHVRLAREANALRRRADDARAATAAAEALVAAERAERERMVAEHAAERERLGAEHAQERARVEAELRGERDRLVGERTEERDRLARELGAERHAREELAVRLAQFEEALRTARRDHEAEIGRRDEELKRVRAEHAEELAAGERALRQRADDEIAAAVADAADLRRALKGARADAEAMRRDRDTAIERAAVLRAEPPAAAWEDDETAVVERPQAARDDGETAVAERAPAPAHAPDDDATTRVARREEPAEEDGWEGDEAEGVRVIGRRRQPPRSGMERPSEPLPGTAQVGARHIEAGPIGARGPGAWIPRTAALLALLLFIGAVLLVILGLR